METPFIIQLRSYKDNRGEFYESYKDLLLKRHNINFEIVQENTCISNKNVVRGFHYQIEPYSQSKLLQVLNGEIKDVLIDLRKGDTYGKVWEFKLNSTNKELLYIPKGFAHGYSALEDNTIVSYKMDTLYNRNSECGIHPLSLNVDWNIKKDDLILSEKDSKLQFFYSN
tara:strand:- start:950 stop:1456 length:507 start_codon:yes stop_codon:yes gene_type:complete